MVEMLYSQGSTSGCTTIMLKLCGQVVYNFTHTHVPLSPSSIIWYQSKGGDAQQLGI